MRTITLDRPGDDHLTITVTAWDKPAARGREVTDQSLDEIAPARSELVDASPLHGYERLIWTRTVDQPGKQDWCLFMFLHGEGTGYQVMYRLKGRMPTPEESKTWLEYFRSFEICNLSPGHASPCPADRTEKFKTEW